jgi:hypothetical protein
MDRHLSTGRKLVGKNRISRSPGWSSPALLGSPSTAALCTRCSGLIVMTLLSCLLPAASADQPVPRHDTDRRRYRRTLMSSALPLIRDRLKERTHVLMTLPTTTGPALRSDGTQPIPPGAASVALASQATAAYQEEQAARRAWLDLHNQTDLNLLTSKLAELGIVPIDEPYITARGQARATLCDLSGVDLGGCDLVDDDDQTPAVRTVYAVTAGSEVRLQTAAAPGSGNWSGDAGPLAALADVGRALWEGPIDEPAPLPDYAELADQQLTYRFIPQTQENEAVCDVLVALTYAVLAVADRVPTAAAALTEPFEEIACRVGYTGG